MTLLVKQLWTKAIASHIWLSKIGLLLDNIRCFRCSTVRTGDNVKAVYKICPSVEIYWFQRPKITRSCLIITLHIELTEWAYKVLLAHYLKIAYNPLLSALKWWHQHWPIFAWKFSSRLRRHGSKIMWQSHPRVCSSVSEIDLNNSMWHYKLTGCNCLISWKQFW